MDLWRDGIHLSLDELDDVLSGEADADGELLRYLVPEAAARSPASCGRARLHGRSPQRPACFAASPKRRQSDAFSALFAGMSPAKRFSPARGPFSPLRASFSFSPARGASGAAAASPTARTRQLKSTVGVFAAGSEACFRGGQRAPEFPLISPSTNFMPTSREIAPSPTSLLLACSSEADVLAFLQPTPGSSPLPTQRALPSLADALRQSPPRISPRLASPHAGAHAGAHALARPEAERGVRRSPRREQARASLAPQLAEDARAAGPAAAGARLTDGAGAGADGAPFHFRARRLGQLQSALSPTRPAAASHCATPRADVPARSAQASASPARDARALGGRRQTPEGAGVRSRPERAEALRAGLFASAESAHTADRAARDAARHGSRGMTVVRASAARMQQLHSPLTEAARGSVPCTPFGVADSPGSDTTALHTPVKGGASGAHFGRRINFTPVKPAGVRTPHGTVTKRAAVFGIGGLPADLTSPDRAEGAALGAASTLASLSNINMMLSRSPASGAQPAERSPTWLAHAERGAGAGAGLGAGTGAGGAAGSGAASFLALEQLSDGEGEESAAQACGLRLGCGAGGAQRALGFGLGLGGASGQQREAEPCAPSVSPSGLTRMRSVSMVNAFGQGGSARPAVSLRLQSGAQAQTLGSGARQDGSPVSPVSLTRSPAAAAAAAAAGGKSSNDGRCQPPPAAPDSSQPEQPAPRSGGFSFRFPGTPVHSAAKGAGADSAHAAASECADAADSAGGGVAAALTPTSEQRGAAAAGSISFRVVSAGQSGRWMRGAAAPK